MTSPRSWFDRGPSRGHYDPGSIVTTDDGTQREVFERLKQDEVQRVAQSRISPSHATLKLRCVKANANPSERRTGEAFLRIPYVSSEFEDSDARAAQADHTFQPEELDVYTILMNHLTVSKFTPKLLGSNVSKQGRLSFVPGNNPGTSPRRSKVERRLYIGVCLSVSVLKEISSTIGIWPSPPSPHNLVWNDTTETLFWVEFRTFSRKKNKRWDEGWLPTWDLVKTPNNRWAHIDWDGDTTGWEY
ncbi:hypothetical protein N7497_008800 [Penicillium chrysogenum]|nr:hypothetical protein N7497_008800 [Penicillium chrysogenum]